MMIVFEFFFFFDFRTRLGGFSMVVEGFDAFVVRFDY